MEIFFNNQLIGIASKSKFNFYIDNIEINNSSKIQESITNELLINKKIYRINILADGLDKNNMKENEFRFNCDMYDYVPFKYSFVKKNNDIYLYSIELF